jgi:hypothetical protein
MWQRAVGTHIPEFQNVGSHLSVCDIPHQMTVTLRFWKNSVWGCELHLCVFGCDPVVGCCGQGDELEGSIKEWTFAWMSGPSQERLLILANNQLDALFMYLFTSSLHVSSIAVLIIRRSNCINTSSGMISLCKWLLGMPVRKELQVPPKPAYQAVTHTD